jgi:predicted Zn-dependent protease
MAARALRLARLAAALAALSACVQNDGSRRFPFVRPSEDAALDAERELGMEFDRELRKHVEVITDPLVAGFINDLGQSIVSQIEPQPFIYRFRVIEDSSLNAFAVPGGYVYFHSGTLMAAGSLDELAGVMGHEIAHVKGHHVARMQERSQWPDLIAGLAGMAGAVATKEPGVLIAVQAANVSAKLSFSRELEAEADDRGAIFMTRAGYDPAGVTRFFERLLEEQRLHPTNLPPYLFSHPQVEDRIESVRARAQGLRPVRPPDPVLVESLPAVQARLALLMDARRGSLPPFAPPPDQTRTDPLLDEVRTLESRGERDAALLMLARAEALEPNDPRVSFEIGELLFDAGRYAEAIQAYRRTVSLDVSRAQVYFKLGLAYRNAGDRQRAVYALEQALERTAASSTQLRQRIEWELEKLTFQVVLGSGFADGASKRTDTPVGRAVDRFRVGDRRMAWWVELGRRFASRAEFVVVRWRAPDGRVVQEAPALYYPRPFLASVLEFQEASGAQPAGEWAVEALLFGDVFDRRTVRVDP